MGRKHKYALLILVGLLVAATFAWTQLRGAAESFQHDADILRLQHLKYYGLLIEEYHDKTGRYPFQGKSEVPIYVHVANDQQVGFIKNAAPYKHEVVSFAEFVRELESSLGRAVEEYYDPQYRPVGKPNFYVYMVHKDAYFFAVHLHQGFPFAERLAEHYYKAEISSAANEQNRAWSPSDLFKDPDFVKATQRPLAKPGFFREREKKYLHHTKQG
jgi:hypothetical protein